MHTHAAKGRSMPIDAPGVAASAANAFERRRNDGGDNFNDARKEGEFCSLREDHSELVTLARETKRSMTDLVRLGLALVKIAIEAERNGNRLIVTTSDGRPVKELVLPS